MVWVRRARTSGARSNRDATESALNAGGKPDARTAVLAESSGGERCGVGTATARTGRCRATRRSRERSERDADERRSSEGGTRRAGRAMRKRNGWTALVEKSRPTRGSTLRAFPASTECSTGSSAHEVLTAFSVVFDRFRCPIAASDYARQVTDIPPRDSLSVSQERYSICSER